MTRLIYAENMIKSLMDMTFYDEDGHEVHDHADRLAIVKSFVDSVPTADAVPVTFERFQSVCQFFAVGFDEDRKKELTCRRKDMIPEGCSWGICDKEHCPYMKVEEV